MGIGGKNGERKGTVTNQCMVPCTCFSKWRVGHVAHVNLPIRHERNAALFLSAVHPRGAISLRGTPPRRRFSPRYTHAVPFLPEGALLQGGLSAGACR